MKSLKQIREASGGKEAYMKFFNSLLKKFGVSSPSELKGKKKKDFFDALDKGWESDDPNDKNEKYEDPEGLDPDTTVDGDEDQADKAVSQVTEKTKLKAGKGKITVDLNWDGSARDKKFAETKYKIKIKPNRYGAIISGDKAKVLAYVSGQDYGMDDEDIEDLMPELMQDYHEGTNYSVKEGFSMRSIGLKGASKRSRDKARGANLSSAELKKAEKIAKKHSGNMKKAMAEIEKIKKGSSETDAVMDILRKANEDVNEAMSKGELKHDKEFMHKKLKGNNNKSMKITTVKALNGVSINGRHVEWSGKVDKLLTKHKVTIRNDRDGDVSVWGKGDDVNNFLKDMGHKAEAHEVGTDKYKKHAKKVTPGEKESLDLQGTGDTGSSKSVKEANRFSKKLKGNAKSLWQRVVVYKQSGKAKHTHGDKEWDAVVDKMAKDTKVSPKDIAAVKQAIQHESVSEGVAVDRRTVGFKAAMIRSEKAKKVREKSKLKKEKKKEQEVLDARYDYDGGVDTVLAAANKSIFGETAANSVASGNVDMAPNAGKKKKKALTVIRRDTY